MLSRTADSLFWLARYMERAENTARMLDVNYQTSLLPQSAGDAAQGWASLLSISELTSAYQTRYGEVRPELVTEFMVADDSNLSSIYNCLRAMRENARAVRGTLTTEVWETTNTTWLEFRRLLKEQLHQRDPAAFFDWVKFRSHLLGGVTVGTMLQDEALQFLRIGGFLERADNSARLLDVKYHAPREAGSDAVDDYYHWSAVLLSVSGFEVYRKVYSNVIQPEKVAELLILNKGMPRSLTYCMARVVSNLTKVSAGHRGETLRQANRLHAELQFGRIDEVFAAGLHPYLKQFLARVNQLGMDISEEYLR
ncbi:alpha-E domain-containing protein [Inhella sp.]|uniref:alpha-E domain-containing protein n=1 Tax=Inhella sp. TaxID=1921806 RepID=UPI0035B22ADF